MFAFRIPGLFGEYIAFSSRLLDCIHGWRRSRCRDDSEDGPANKRLRLSLRKMRDPVDPLVGREDAATVTSGTVTDFEDDASYAVDDGYVGCGATLSIDVLLRLGDGDPSSLHSLATSTISTYTVVYASPLGCHSHERDAEELQRHLSDIPRKPAEQIDDMVRCCQRLPRCCCCCCCPAD